MTLSEVKDLLGAEVFSAPDLSARVESVDAADLMSDVLAHSRTGMFLLTDLSSPQAIRTAVVADLVGVVLLRGKRPSKETVALARESRMPLLCTGLSMFQASGVLYERLARE